MFFIIYWILMEKEGMLAACTSKKERKKRDKYNRIPLKTKLIFYHKVLQQHADVDDVKLWLFRWQKGSTSKNRLQKPYLEITGHIPKKKIQNS